MGTVNIAIAYSNTWSTAQTSISTSLHYKIKHDVSCQHLNCVTRTPVSKIFCRVRHPASTPVSDSECYLPCPRKICRVGHPHPSQTLTHAPVSM
uniref:Uncharacterized protein n=1 Tax=Arundo donax TaxID=35708 RepID=A0A0A9GR13_ARUDO